MNITSGQEQLFPDGLSIVCKFDYKEIIEKHASKYNQVSSENGKTIGYVNYRCGVTDYSGNIIIPEEYINISRNKDIFEVNRNNKYGLIDKTGKILTQCKFSYLHKMSDQLYKVKLNGKFGIINYSGEIIIPCQYNYIGNISDNGTIQVFKNERHKGVINTEGKEIIPCKYSLINEDSGFYRVYQNNKWGLLDYHGNTVIPCIYSIISKDSGFFRVRQNNKWGLLDYHGNIVIPPIYEVLSHIGLDLFKAQKNNQIGIINSKNQILVDFKYALIHMITNDRAECCECEDLKEAKNQKEIKQYTQKGYVLLEDPTRLMVLCKNPRYQQLEIKNN